MTVRSFFIGAVSVSMLLSACGQSTPGAAMPTSNSGPSSTLYPANAVHHLPPGVGVVGMSLSPASVSVAVGGTLQFTPTIQLTDGQTVYDPQLVQWSLGDPYAGTIDSSGVLTPTTARITDVRIDLDGKSADATVSITPPVYSWQQVASPTTEDLYACKLLSHDEAWAAGAQGTVLHYIGGQWQSYQGYGFDAGTSLRAMAFSDPSTGMLVGSEATSGNSGACVVYAYANGNWVPMSLNVSGELLGVAVADRNDAWAVGDDSSGKILVMHWDGQTWQRDNTISGSGRLDAVQMIGNQAWAVGQADGEPAIYHYSGSAWSQDRLPVTAGLFHTGELKGICMLNEQQGYAVGVQQATVGFPGGLVYKFDARGQNLLTWSSWSQMSAADPKTQYLDQVPLNAVAMLGSGQGWIVGQTVTPKVWLPFSPLNAVYGNFLDFDGSTYSIDNSYFKYNLSPVFNGIDALPQGDGLVVGSQGYLMQRTYDWRQQGNNPAYPTNGLAPVPGTSGS